MRDIWLVAWVALGLGFTVRFPFVGLLLWEWLSLMAPHMQAYGFSRTLPLNFIVAIVTILSWLFSKEPKRLPTHPIIVLSALLLVWMTFNSFFAFDPSWSWQYWDLTWKIYLFGFLISVLATNRVRIEAIVWVAVISLSYFGIKGGVFTLMVGGVHRVYGPESTIIGDNNQLALALVMTVPLIGYLQSSITNKRLWLFLNSSIVIIAISIIGSYSRGAYIATAAIALLALLRSRRKFALLTILLVAAAAAYYFMPSQIVDRMSTMQSVNTDGSFQGRVMAWHVAFKYATDHFPFGAGFYGPQLPGIFQYYYPNESPHAAHSIFFQVLGEHGFIGLGLYLIVLLISFMQCRKLAKTKQVDETVWIQRLSGMMLISLFAFAVGGAALSMAYYDLYIIQICLLPQLVRLSQPAKIERYKVRPPALQAAGA